MNAEQVNNELLSSKDIIKIAAAMGIGIFERMTCYGPNNSIGKRNRFLFEHGEITVHVGHLDGDDLVVARAELVDRFSIELRGETKTVIQQAEALRVCNYVTNKLIEAGIR